ncbi:MAG TPA: tetratricopeptide repeat protein, partial [Vicinamibacteria bacterium]|nr:tetratricopeptide repeat protein [Vicinamibacteria bacterium]
GLADALIASGKMDEAVSALEAGVKECPQNPSLLLSLGEAYSRIGRLADARARLEEARRRDPVGPSGRRAVELLQQFPAK